MQPQKKINFFQESWLNEALCANDKTIDPEIFFSESETSRKQAIFICLSCPVRQICLIDALKMHVSGIRGATTERERKLDKNRLLEIVNNRLSSTEQFLTKKPPRKRKAKNK